MDARDNTGWTPLHWAAFSSENPDIIGILLEAGAEVDARDNDGWTPLHWAATSSENPTIIRTLIEAGAKLDAQDSLGITALSLLKDNEKLEYISITN